MAASNYQKLEVWQKSRRLAVDLYRATRKFPREESFGLVSQIRRAAISIACNIAEGQGRTSLRETKRFVSFARGSVFELETQIVIAADLEFLDDCEAWLERTLEITRMLNGMLRYFTKRLRTR